MIKIKATFDIKTYSSYNTNMFREENIKFNYNSMSNLFNIILNKLVEYKNRDVYFCSINGLIGIMKVELKSINESDLDDFFTIFQYVFDVLDNKRIVFGGWYHYINQDINDIENITMHQLHQLISSDEYKKTLTRKIKLQKLSSL